MKKEILLWLTMIIILIGIISISQALAAEFHVTNATEFQNALNTATNNGEDDTIYLTAGTYQGNFTYIPPKPWPKSLTITGEPGVRAEDIIIDGKNSGTALYFYDWTETEVAEIRINGITVQNGNTLGNGGGIYAVVATYNISITNCIIKNNTAKYSGGGAYLSTELPGGGGTITLENNLILDNTVTEIRGGSKGGGVRIFCIYGNYIIRNNIIVRNTAQGMNNSQGGGLWVGWSMNHIIHVIGNTIYSNQANRGGGLYFSAGNTANVYNNIIYGNTATGGGDIYFETVTNRIGYNNNYSDIYGTWTESGNNLNADPLFVDSTNNDFHFQLTSLMINAGTTAVPNPPGLPLTDFEGNPRTMGSAPDIGAYESSPINPYQGTYVMEITISGSDFGARKGKVIVGNTSLKILDWTDGLIQCQLTRALPPGPYNVTIRPATKGASPIVLENAFTVKAPEIDSVDPTSGSTGDEITINGFFFGTKKGKVTLGGKTCKVLSWTMVPIIGESEIKFMVPKGLSPGGNELKVTTTGVGSDIINFSVE